MTDPARPPPLLLPPSEAFPREVVVDLDGTLLDPAGTLRPRSRAALTSLIDRGVPVTVATARPARSVRVPLGELFDAVSVVHMSGTGLARQGAVQVIARIPAGAVRAITGIAREMAPGARIVAEFEGHEFGASAMPPDDYLLLYGATREMVLPLEASRDRAVAKVAINGLRTPLAEVASRIRAEVGATVEVIADRNGTFLNVVPAGVSKEAALHTLWHDQDAPWAGVLAFGDDLADLEMLRRAEHGVAMANATPEVIAAATYLTESNDRDGVAAVLEQYDWNRS
ncbi:MAG: HAD family hydrolase [Chloroflexi bacterium]|nr:HAD family hydrolase [Chloroflexota bacterium]